MSELEIQKRWVSTAHGWKATEATEEGKITQGEGRMRRWPGQSSEKLQKEEELAKKTPER